MSSSEPATMTDSPTEILPDSTSETLKSDTLESEALEPDADADRVCEDVVCEDLAAAIAVSPTWSAAKYFSRGWPLATIISLTTHAALFAAAIVAYNAVRHSPPKFLSLGDPRGSSISSDAPIIISNADHPIDFALPHALISDSAELRKLEIPPEDPTPSAMTDQTFEKDLPAPPDDWSPIGPSTVAKDLQIKPIDDPDRSHAAVAQIPHEKKFVPPVVLPPPGGRRGVHDGLDGRGIPIPQYPTESRQHGEQGLVELDVEILPDGTIGEVAVKSTPGYPRLVAAATQAVRAAKFDPGKLDGEPIGTRIIVPFNFVLR